MEVTLRPQRPNDGKISWLYKRYVNMWRYAICESPVPITEKTEVEFYEKCLTDETCIRRAIIADGLYVGNIFVDGIENGKAELHTHIFNCGYWQKGIGTRAQKLFLDELFRNTDLEIICQLIACNNISNVVIAKKLGFENLGEVQGKVCSVYYYEMTKEQWERSTNLTI